MRILAFGDSITYGAWDTEGGWVERIKREAHTQTVDSDGANKLQVINLGIGGNTSTKILNRLSAEINARYSQSWPFVFVFCFGTNDERSIDGVAETPIDQFENNVREIIKIAQQFTDKIIFLGIPPLGKPIVHFKEQEYSDERILEYENVVQSIVESEHLRFLPLRSHFEEAGLEQLFSYDNLHPNSKGHELIAKTAQAELDRFISL